MKVLVACEESQVVCLSFRNKGHEAYSCDVIDCSGGHPEWHIKRDVLEILEDDWDLILAYPPCTRLCNSGVRWLRERDLWEEMIDAAVFFRLLLTKGPCERRMAENPIMHRYAKKIIGQEPDQIIQPWQFGHGETKATCLWLRNLEKLKPTNIVEGREPRIWKMAKTPDRGRLRSITYQGIADAKAEQWSNNQ